MRGVAAALGLVLLGVAIWAFVWAVDHDQFEDLDQAGARILFEEPEGGTGDDDDEEVLH